MPLQEASAKHKRKERTYKAIAGQHVLSDSSYSSLDTSTERNERMPTRREREKEKGEVLTLGVIYIYFFPLSRDKTVHDAKPASQLVFVISLLVAS